MDAEFWHRRWKEKNIGFHEPDGNQLLVKHFSRLGLSEGSRVFLPLCGKTLDIRWLLSNGYSVAGAELSEIAVQELFSQLNITPQVMTIDELKRYSGANIDIFVGDIFALSQTVLRSVDAIYDRAALVALPEAVRKQYSAHMLAITNTAPQLLICFEYDQSLLEGPPFSISDAEVEQHYAQSYDLELLASVNVEGGLKGQCVAAEKVWLLHN